MRPNQPIGDNHADCQSGFRQLFAWAAGESGLPDADSQPVCEYVGLTNSSLTMTVLGRPTSAKNSFSVRSAVFVCPVIWYANARMLA